MQQFNLKDYLKNEFSLPKFKAHITWVWAVFTLKTTFLINQFSDINSIKNGYVMFELLQIFLNLNVTSCRLTSLLDKLVKLANQTKLNR